VKVLGGLVAAIVLGSLLVGPAESATLPVEPYAAYQPQTRCAPKAKPGAQRLLRWLVVRHGGEQGRIGAACRGRSISEHKEGRALDWALDARKVKDRARAARMLAELFGTNSAGETDALARRMGVMYVIWNDRIYRSYDGFRPGVYRPSGCHRLAACSATARHRDHVHISLSRAGGLARTSFYQSR
jgi:hypothetical protein